MRKIFNKYLKFKQISLYFYNIKWHGIKMQTSCGILLYKKVAGQIEYFLVHPGGPFFKNKDAGYWGIPKGLVEEGENLIEAAKREFTEETGIIPEGELVYLGEVKQKGGKIVHCWGCEYLSNESVNLVCNLFDLEYPPKSGKVIKCPEVDKGNFFNFEEAIIKINEAQKAFIYRLLEIIKV